MMKQKKIVSMIGMLSLLILFGMSNSIYAQSYLQRTKIADGLTLIRSGNTFLIESDELGMTYSLNISRQKTSDNSWAYDVLCENKYTKAVAKRYLRDTIENGVVALGTGIGFYYGGKPGAAAGKMVGEKIKKYASDIASIAYDDVCNYFND